MKKFEYKVEETKKGGRHLYEVQEELNEEVRHCTGCKWYDSGICSAWNVYLVSSRRARSENGDCGPSAKYYEPKEQQP